MKKTQMIGWMMAAAVVMSCGTLARAQEEAWTFKVTPYAWAMGVEGDVGKGNLTAPVDVDFLDAIDDLDLAGMLAVEARKGDWGILADMSYLDLSDDKSTAVGKIDVEVEQWILQAFALYRVKDEGKTTVDVGAGVRSMDMDNDIDIAGRDASATENWVDPVVVARVRQQFGPNCYGVLAGDIGGFDVASKLTWQITAAAGYSFSETVSMLIGYRYLDYDYDDDIVFDAETSGLGIGLQFNL